jgi:hypothetical protein
VCAQHGHVVSHPCGGSRGCVELVAAKSGTPPWPRFLLQFHQPLVYILLAVGALAAFEAVEFEKWVRFVGKRREGRALE